MSTFISTVPAEAASRMMSRSSSNWDSSLLSFFLGHWIESLSDELCFRGGNELDLHVVQEVGGGDPQYSGVLHA